MCVLIRKRHKTGIICSERITNSTLTDSFLSPKKAPKSCWSLHCCFSFRLNPDLTSYLVSFTSSCLMKLLASSLVLLKNSSSNSKFTAEMFARVSCLESPRNGDAPLNLKQKDKYLNYVEAHRKFLLINSWNWSHSGIQTRAPVVHVSDSC